MVEKLTAIYSGLSRKKDDIFTYLIEVYVNAAELPRLGNASAVRSAIANITSHKIDLRTARSPVRLLIEGTCEGEVKARSRYANALRFAKVNGCPPAALRTFIGENGGIEACAKKYTACR
ncbi:MAG: hypothetical protein JO220_16080 [Hyphomicrobiales bacterium]|nr:hypothetical protein [Hyphomicrobiales bacterium]